MCCLPINQVEERVVDSKDLPKKSDSGVLEEHPETNSGELRGYYEEGGALLE
jgi:hypothetical protein